MCSLGLGIHLKGTFYKKNTENIERIAEPRGLDRLKGLDLDFSDHVWSSRAIKVPPNRTLGRTAILQI